MDPPALHLLLDAPWTASRNMARDEAILDGNRSVLRRTLWRCPSVTIGRFQGWRLVEHEGEWCGPVRRITGGGAIFHGEDLTLALVSPSPSPLLPDRAPEAIATRVADAIGEALAVHVPGLRPRGGAFAERAQIDILDCFDRATPSDLGVETPAGDFEKIMGLALHRRRGRILVQASIRRQDRLALSGDRAILDRIARALGATPQLIGDLADEEEERSWRLMQSRYGSARWNRRIRE